MFAGWSSLSGSLKLVVVAITLPCLAAIGVGIYAAVDRGGRDGATTNVLGEKFLAPSTPSAPAGPAGTGGAADPNSTTATDTQNVEQLDLSGQLGGVLRPGEAKTLTVRISNPNPIAVAVTSVKALVGTPTGGAHDSGLPACAASWVTVGEYAGGSTSLVAPAHGTVSVDLVIELRDLAAVNQDNCKNATFPIDLSAVGTQAQ